MYRSTEIKINVLYDNIAQGLEIYVGAIPFPNGIGYPGHIRESLNRRKIAFDKNYNIDNYCRCNISVVVNIVVYYLTR
ncbi:MAG TPA: hypothetical protein PKW80_05575 [Bacteroidales bacterium]|nr:hypothetical protein [Bacteroidales bacterium]